jgi:hypothetical protein
MPPILVQNDRIYRLTKKGRAFMKKRNLKAIIAASIA